MPRSKVMISTKARTAGGPPSSIARPPILLPKKMPMNWELE
jgi:hypothetical protein